VKRLEKALYWTVIAAATGMTAWFGGAFIMWAVHQFSLVE
jgi:hypothetical protein